MIFRFYTLPQILLAISFLRRIFLFQGTGPIHKNNNILYVSCHQLFFLKPDSPQYRLLVCTDDEDLEEEGERIEKIAAMGSKFAYLAQSAATFGQTIPTKLFKSINLFL